METADERHRQRLRDGLAAVSPVLAKAGIWHALAFGTLLGAVRDGDIIVWDHDLDLFVRPADLPRIAEACAASGELSIAPRRWGAASFTLTGAADGWLLLPGATLHHRGFTVGELWAPVAFADGILRLYDLASEGYLWPASSFPAFLAEELGEAEVDGRAYPVFRHAETWLEWTYGPDWRTPRKAPADRGDATPGHGYSGERLAIDLAAQVRWCEEQGWDRSRYAGLPAWPRRVRCAMPWSPAWSGLEELVARW